MSNFVYSGFPFVRLLLPLLGGRLISLIIPVNFLFFWILLLPVVAGSLFLMTRITFSYKNRSWWGVVIGFALFIAGFINSPNYYFNKNLFEHDCLYHAVVQDITKSVSTHQSIILKCQVSLQGEDYYFPVAAYFSKDSAFVDLLPGDQVVFKAKLSDLKLTGNPAAFEYANYLKIRGVQGQLFLSSTDFLRMGHAFSFTGYFYQIKLMAESKLRSLQLNKEQFGIVSALVLGDKSFLDFHTKANFSSSGAIHVLSVSGLHVGTLYLLLIALFGKVRYGSWSGLKVFIMLLVLWLYAALTGMSPSVFRATIMFSVMLIARWKSHSYNVYHSMAIAAFVILILDPYSVINAGFWLSFLAVLSIVYFYPRIYHYFYFTTPWGKYLWALLSVSFAAQIATFPLSIYLFGFFPTWFWLSNLLIVPILPVVLLGSIGVIILPFNSLPVQLIEEIVQSGIVYMSEMTQWIGTLPYSKFTKIQLLSAEMTLVYVYIVFMVLWMNLKSGKYLAYALLFLLLTIGMVTFKSYQKSQEVFFAIHQIKDKTAITYTTKQKGVCLYTDSLSTKEISHAIYPLWLKQECVENNNVCIRDSIFYPISLRNKNLLVINDAKRIIPKAYKGLDVMILTSHVNYNCIMQIVNNYKGTVVFDASFSKYRCNRLKKQLKYNISKLHFVSIDGAFVVQL
ncbi:ComEC family competence protein [Labilibacter sediminis]|nr:ComEC family competence protein [Labilibacter sediminis]